jgi:hydrogenase/urease accessory protein HupE
MVRVAAALLLWLAMAAPALAHELRPGYLELVEESAGRFRVTWKRPAIGETVIALRPTLPASCREEQVRRGEGAPAALLERWRIDCGSSGLSGQRLTVDSLATTMMHEGTYVDVLVRVAWRNGSTATGMLQPGSPSWTVPGAGGEASGIWAFFWVGIDHILLGADHLLFVLGLLLIVHGTRLLLKTITAFTVAHSITLALATLGYARAPILPLNACIALSILLLGPEILRVERGETSLTVRYPWLVAFAFGLFHGFGFANGLQTMGLPPSEVPLALLLFNLGVEAGQVAFVALMLLLRASFRQLEVRWPRWVQRLPAYAIGSSGAFWLLTVVARMGVAR